MNNTFVKMLAMFVMAFFVTISHAAKGALMGEIIVVHYDGEGAISPMDDGMNLMYTAKTAVPEVWIKQEHWVILDRTPSLIPIPDYRFVHQNPVLNMGTWTAQTYTYSSPYYPSISHVVTTHGWAAQVRYWGDFNFDWERNFYGEASVSLHFAGGYQNATKGPANMPITSMVMVVYNQWGPNVVPLYIPNGTVDITFNVWVGPFDYFVH